MIKSFAAGAGLVLVLAVPALAQQPVVDARVAESQRGQFAPPLCTLRKDSRLNNVERGLKAYAEEQAPDRRERGLNDARSNLAQAMTADAGNGAAWYYLGRYHLALGDMAGMDSAWTRAVTMLPDCDVDITTYRQNAWATLTNAGIEFQNAGNLDSAKVLYARANLAFQGLPHAFMNMGVIYANEDRNDSAAVYFAQAVRATEGDTTMVEERKALLLNLATIYQRLEQHRDALNTFGAYLQMVPDDGNVSRQVAASYRRLDMVDSAAAIDARLLAELNQMDMAELDEQELLELGAGLYDAGQFAQAAEALGRLVARNPYHREALLRLANARMSLNDGAGLLTTVLLIREIEPMNEEILRLHGQTLREMGGRDDELTAVIEALVGLPVSVDVAEVTYTGNEGRIRINVTGRTPLKPDGTPIPAAPLNLVFEFITAQGAVVGSGTVAVPALAPGQSQEFTVTAPVTREVAGWRYRQG